MISPKIEETIDSEADSAERWENGCNSDRVRNEFIVPHVSDILNRECSKVVLDIGSGTGYCTRKIASKIRPDAEWTLLDGNSQRLNLSKKEWPQLITESHVADLFPSETLSHKKFNAILVIFTLLEIENVDFFIENMINILESKGIIIVATPDVLVDVVNSAENNNRDLFSYQSGLVKLRKIDNFTQEPYPFFAHRFEHLVSSFIKRGVSLFEFQTFSLPLGETYLLAFRMGE